MTLYIDTIDFNKVTFAIAANKKIIKKSFKIDPHKSHETLAKLEEFLKSKKIKHDSIKQIVVNKGPGSYTGVRVGITLAQALSLGWKISMRAIANDNFFVH